jgi:flagellar basal body-associated protein FliL
MAKDESKAPSSAQPKKSKLGLIIGLAVGLVVMIGGVVAGVLVGPKLMGAPAPAAASGATEPPSGSEREDSADEQDLPPPEKVISSSFEPIIIDLRGDNGEVHHLKVGLAAELRDTITEDEFKLVRPRGREAALTYLRTLSFKEVTNPKKYAKIKTELSKRVVKAVGKERVHRILLVDFVAQ